MNTSLRFGGILHEIPVRNLHKPGADKNMYIFEQPRADYLQTLADGAQKAFPGVEVQYLDTDPATGKTTRYGAILTYNKSRKAKAENLSLSADAFLRENLRENRISHQYCAEYGKKAFDSGVDVGGKIFITDTYRD